MSLLGPRSRSVAKLTAVLRIIFQQDNPHDAEAVVLDLVQPPAAGRQSCGFNGKARRDEAGGEGTLLHEPVAGTEALFRKWNRPFRDGHHSGRSHGLAYCSPSDGSSH